MRHSDILSRPRNLGYGITHKKPGFKEDSGLVDGNMVFCLELKQKC